ncbi:hypothetical protein LshimejAT787_0103360 [Lyophyllum shimeji]|uniref:RBR-type E3 ubiquitin transferase n=1 Tax=Lyophyllum shimeji TaxID=47721 RepID=A0A9P3PDF7_LYOSH|nr:hypothetical protein LshimejAT787_0103360 [Lyophyllum shimeji]
MVVMLGRILKRWSSRILYGHDQVSAHATGCSNDASEPSTSEARPEQKAPSRTDRTFCSLSELAASYLAIPALPLINNAQKEAERLRSERETFRIETEAALTTQHMVLGSTLITCGAGLEIRSVITGFESRRFTIYNLPPDTKSPEVAELFTQHGLSRDKIVVLSMHPTPGDCLKAEVLTSGINQIDTTGHEIACKIDGTEFKKEIIACEVSKHTPVNTTGRTSALQYQANTLTITLAAPSTCVIATYPTLDLAREMVKRLDGRIVNGRKIKAEMNQAPTGPVLRFFYNPASVKVSGMSADDLSIYGVIGYPEATTSWPTKSKTYYLPDALKYLREHLASLHDSGVECFDCDRETADVVTVRVRFRSWDHADRARASLEGKRGKHQLPFFCLSLPEPAHVANTLCIADGVCPICYDVVSQPVQLSCKHVYCTDCIRHYLTTAAETKVFPLACMGNKTTCNVPIPIPVIQRFLTPQQYEHLVDVAFTAHLNRNTRDFGYCPTPDCPEIYRADTKIMMDCPSCAKLLCTSCNEGHTGMSCAKWKAGKAVEEARLNNLWATTHGAKRCPSCFIWIQKISGCDHMSCRCGGQMCWTCGKKYNKMGGHRCPGRPGPEQREIDRDLQYALILQQQLNQGREVPVVGQERRRRGGCIIM